MNIVKAKERYFSCNTYIVEGNGEAIIIDAGASLELIKDKLVELNNPKVVAILLTHAHFDHILALEKYMQHFGCNVYVDDMGVENLVDAVINYSAYTDNPFVIQNDLIQRLPEGEVLQVGNFDINIVRTHGHTNDSVCYIVGDVMFTGDTLFFYTIGRTDLVNSNLNEMLVSLERLKDYTGYREYYPGHGVTFDADDMIDFLRSRH